MVYPFEAKSQPPQLNQCFCSTAQLPICYPEISNHKKLIIWVYFGLNLNIFCNFPSEFDAEFTPQKPVHPPPQFKQFWCLENDELWLGYLLWRFFPNCGVFIYCGVFPNCGIFNGRGWSRIREESANKNQGIFPNGGNSVPLINCCSGTELFPYL